MRRGRASATPVLDRVRRNVSIKEAVILLRVRERGDRGPVRDDLPTHLAAGLEPRRLGCRRILTTPEEEARDDGLAFTDRAGERDRIIRRTPVAQGVRVECVD